MRCMPAEEQYGDLCCQAFQTVLDLEPNFFGHRSYMPLAELGRMYQKFQLVGPGAEPIKVATAAKMGQMTLEGIPEFYGDGLTMLRWLCRLTTPGLVVFFMVAAETDADIRHLDFGNPWTTAMSDAELHTVADNCRDALSLIVSGCERLSDFGFCGENGLAHRCSYLEKINVDSCKLLSDASLDAIAKHCVDLRSLNVANCSRFSDLSLAPLIETCKFLREIVLSHCQLVTDNTLIAIAQFSQYLELLHVDYCMHVTNTGLIVMSKATCAPILTSLDLSACRRISDHGVTALLSKATRLNNLSLFYCGKVTDRSIKALTHQCNELVTLNLGDLFQVGSKRSTPQSPSTTLPAQ